jgi:hypothetical protein
MIGVLVSVLLLAEAAVVPAPDDAESLFREGLKAYDAKQYARAIEAFEAAHKLSPLPEIQYDIAMARRAIGDCRGAADGFDAFIAAASPEDPLLARAQARRAELGSCASAPAIGSVPAPSTTAEKLSPAPSLPAFPSGVSVAANAPTPTIMIAPAPHRSRPEHLWLRNTCFASAGGTAVLGLGGLVFGWQARSAQQEVEGAATWDDPIARADERGRTYGQVASTLLISAGVTTAIAAVSCIAMSRSRLDR